MYPRVLPRFHYPDMAILAMERSSEVIAGFLDNDLERFEQGAADLSRQLDHMRYQLVERKKVGAMLESIKQAGQLELELRED